MAAFQMSFFERTAIVSGMPEATSQGNVQQLDIDRLLENFEVLAGNSTGLRELRTLLVQLAVQGKLSVRNPKDGSAEPLLHAAREVRLARINAGNVKDASPLPIVTADEAPFGIPDSWVWTRIGSAMKLINGRAFKPSDWRTSGVPIVRIQNLNNPKAPFNYCDFDVESKFHVAPADFRISWSGTPGTSFGAHIWNGPAGILNQHIFRAEMYGNIYEPRFLRLAINARLDEMIAQAHGGVGLQHITKGKLEALCIPLPPLAEQKRIVVKVDQLMALCDQLEAKQARKREVGDRWAKAALGALTSAEGPEEFQDAWRRVAENFEELINRPELVLDLRASLIELAIRGNLTSTPPGAESVNTLLERIGFERKMAPGTVKNLPPLEAEEIPFTVPGSWQWVRWGDLTLQTSSGWSPQCENRPCNEEEWGVLKVSAVSWGRFKPEENKALPNNVQPRHEFAVRAGDFLMSRANTSELVGRSVVVDDTRQRLILSDKIVRCVFSRWIEKKFMNIYNRSSVARAHYVANASGTSDSMKNISREVILTMPVPLPPLVEQQLIVSRVDQLMRLCDDLEEKLRARDEKAAKLARALVAQVVG